MSGKHILASVAWGVAIFAAGFGFPVAAQQPAKESAAGTTYVASAAEPFANPFSSSSSSADAAEHFLQVDSTVQPPVQPPAQPRYGRPLTRDRGTTPDGANRFAFDFGVGGTIPMGNTNAYLDTSYSFQAGAGYNYSRTLGLMFQFAWDNFGFQGATLATQKSVYGLASLDGTSHVWSASLQPILNFYTSDTFGAYVTAGAGYYHKTANFSVPTSSYACSGFGFCYQYQANQTVDKYTSNAPGASGALGFTYKLSPFSPEKIFIEGRYVFVDNEPRGPSATDHYPPNSHRTTYIPVAAGIRW